MKVRSILIECDIENCASVFRAQFVTAAEMAKHNNAAKREGWRQIRYGFNMIQVCPNHPRVL